MLPLKKTKKTKKLLHPSDWQKISTLTISSAKKRAEGGAQLPRLEWTGYSPLWRII